MKIDIPLWREDGSSRQQLDYSSLIIPLVKAVQELSSKVDSLKSCNCKGKK